MPGTPATEVCVSCGVPPLPLLSRLREVSLWRRSSPLPTFFLQALQFPLLSLACMEAEIKRTMVVRDRGMRPSVVCLAAECIGRPLVADGECQPSRARADRASKTDQTILLKPLPWPLLVSESMRSAR